MVKSQFSYCSLVWMFCSRTSNNMINKVHERALRVLLNDYESDFGKLLHINNGVCNHHRNIQTLLIEILKIEKGFAPPIMASILKGRNKTYSVRNFQEFETERKIILYFGLKTISYRSPQLWSLLPEHMRQLNSLDQFKRSVSQWVCNTCPCRLCKVYLQHVGFL